MTRRFASLTRSGLVLFALLLFAQLLPTAFAFTNGQNASLVIGQANFTTSTPATTATTMVFPRDVAIDPSSGKVFVADTTSSRVLRFAAGTTLTNGVAAEAVFGQASFTTNGTAISQNGMNQPYGVAVDSVGRLWVADTNNNRVLRFDSAATKASGSAADGVFGQADFTTNATASTQSGINKPYGVAVDSAGRLWVADTNNSRVLRFDSAASKANGAPADGVLGQTTFTNNTQNTTQNTLSLPRRLTLDSAGRLWVADSGNSRVLRFDSAASKANGAPADGVLGQADFISAFQPSPPTQSSMSGSTGVAVDSAGSLWVVDTNNHRALRFDNAASKANGAAADGVLGQTTFTTRVSATSQNGLRDPWGVTVDSADNVWVADFNNSRVLRFDGPIKPTITWTAPAPITYGTALSATQLNATAGGVPGTFTYTPPLGTVLNVGAGQVLSVTFTPTDSATYTSATATVTIDVGQATQTITFAAPTAKTTSDAPFTLSATGGASGQPVTFSSFTPDVCTVSGSTVTLVAVGVCGITANQAGNANYSAAAPVSQSFAVTASAPALSFTDGQAASLVLGQPNFTSSNSAATASGMTLPNDVAIDPISGKLFVAEHNNSRVLRFASLAALVNGAAAEGVLGQANFTSVDPATTASGLQGPYGLTVDSAGRLWVADTFNNRVLRFDNAATKANGAPADGVLGQLNFTNGSATVNSSRMFTPEGVAVDSTGRLWVADTGSSRVLRFDNAASKVNGAPADGVLGQPDFTSIFPATTASGLNAPAGIAVDSAGRLWVADTDNHRALRFDNAASKANGAAADGVLGQADFTSSVAATTANRMNKPAGVIVDSTGRLWVADTTNNRVLRFENAAAKANGAAADGVLGQGTFTTSAATIVAATTASSLNAPSGVAVESNGTLWVADTGNHRVLRFGSVTSQTITFGALTGKTVGDAPFTLSATTSAGLTVSFSSTTPAVCTVSGNTVTVLTAGTCTIAANQSGNASVSAAPQVTQSLTVAPAAGMTSQTITFGALTGKTLGTAPFTLSATASSGLAVSFSSTTPTVCTVTGNTVTLLTAGTCTIAANQGGNATFSAAPTVTQSFAVTAATSLRQLYLPLATR